MARDGDGGGAAAACAVNFMKTTWLRLAWAVGLALAGVSVSLAQVVATPPPTKHERTADVIYGRKAGMALTLDVFRPEHPNGAAVFFMVSGGFNSAHSSIAPARFDAFLRRGYTVIAVVHGSQPKFHVLEIMADIERAVRFVRHHAAKFGVDPQRFGITGTSSGGHLSLMTGLRGGPGKPDAKDPVDRESSAVQAVACFCPPTDFRNWGAAGDDQLGVGAIGSRFKGAWDPARIATAEAREALNREVAPVLFVHAAMPPTLVIHGDADQLVPLYQARIFEAKAREVGARHRLVVREGKDHTWPEMAADAVQFADWFDAHLTAKR